MTSDQLLAPGLAKPRTWEDGRWEDGRCEGDVVARVGSKIFAFPGAVAPGQPAMLGLTCGATREAAGEWRLRYPGEAPVMPNIGRSGGNTLRIGGTIPDGELPEALDASYRAVVSTLPRRDRPGSAELEGPG